MNAQADYHYRHSPGGRPPQQRQGSNADGAAAAAATSQPASNNNSANADPSATAGAGAGAFGSPAPASAAKENRENWQRPQLDQQQSPFTSPARHTRKAPGTGDNGGEGAKKTPQSSKRRKMNPEDERATMSTPRLPPPATSALPPWSPSQNHQGRGLSNPDPFSRHPFSPSAAAPLPPPNAATSSRFSSTNAPGVQENSASSAPLVPTSQRHIGFPATTTQPGAPASGLTQPQARPTNTPSSSSNTASNGCGSSYLAPPPAPRDSGSPGDDGSFFSSTPSASSGSGLSSNMDSSPADDPTQDRTATGGMSSTNTQQPGGGIGGAPGLGQQHTDGTGISGRPRLSAISEETISSLQFSGDDGAEPQQQQKQQQAVMTGTYEERLASFCARYAPGKLNEYIAFMAQYPGYENDVLIQIAEGLEKDPAILGVGSEYFIRAVFERYDTELTAQKIDKFVDQAKENKLKAGEIIVTLANHYKFQPSDFGFQKSRLFKDESAESLMRKCFSEKFSNGEKEEELNIFVKKLHAHKYHEEQVFREVALKHDKFDLDDFDIRNHPTEVDVAKARTVRLLEKAAHKIEEAIVTVENSMNPAQCDLFLQQEVPDEVRRSITDAARLLGDKNQQAATSNVGTGDMSAYNISSTAADQDMVNWTFLEGARSLRTKVKVNQMGTDIFGFADVNNIEECMLKIKMTPVDDLLLKLKVVKERNFQESGPYHANLSYNGEIPQQHPIQAEDRTFWGTNEIEQRTNIASWVRYMLLPDHDRHFEYYPVRFDKDLKQRFMRPYPGKLKDSEW